jgi:hypothetical protein
LNPPKEHPEPNKIDKKGREERKPRNTEGLYFV